MRLREQAKDSPFAAGALLLASRGVPTTAKALAGAALEAEMMLTVIALARATGKR